MISNYANQALSWEVAGALNAYAEPTYATAVTIYGRKETGFKMVRNAQGQEIVSSAVVFTQSLVSANDLIDSQLVVAVNNAIQLGGTSGFREVYLI